MTEIPNRGETTVTTLTALKNTAENPFLGNLKLWMLNDFESLDVAKLTSKKLRDSEKISQVQEHIQEVEIRTLLRVFTKIRKIIISGPATGGKTSLLMSIYDCLQNSFSERQIGLLFYERAIEAYENVLGEKGLKSRSKWTVADWREFNWALVHLIDVEIADLSVPGGITQALAEMPRAQRLNGHLVPLKEDRGETFTGLTVKEDPEVTMSIETLPIWVNTKRGIKQRNKWSREHNTLGSRLAHYMAGEADIKQLYIERYHQSYDWHEENRKNADRSFKHMSKQEREETEWSIRDYWLARAFRDVFELALQDVEKRVGLVFFWGLNTDERDDLSVQAAYSLSRNRRLGLLEKNSLIGLSVPNAQSTHHDPMTKYAEEIDTLYRSKITDYFPVMAAFHAQFMASGSH